VLRQRACRVDKGTSVIVNACILNTLFWQACYNSFSAAQLMLCW
jgi:hypothetical protein